MGEQWFLILLGFPFIFLAGINDLFMPDYVGKVIDALVAENYAGKGGVKQRMIEWFIILAFGAACTFL